MDRTGGGSRRSEAFTGIAEEGSKTRASLSPPTNPEGGVQQAPPMRASGIHVPLGDGIGWLAMTEPFPGQSKEGFAGGGIDCPEISNLGEQDTDRIAATDVARLVARRRIGEGEDNGVPDAERSSGGHRKDRVADSTSLDVRYPLFVSGVVVHLRLQSRNGHQTNHGSWPPTD